MATVSFDDRKQPQILYLSRLYHSRRVRRTRRTGEYVTLDGNYRPTHSGEESANWPFMSANWCRTCCSRAFAANCKPMWEFNALRSARIRASRPIKCWCCGGGGCAKAFESTMESGQEHSAFRHFHHGLSESAKAVEPAQVIKFLPASFGSDQLHQSLLIVGSPAVEVFQQGDQR
jgi:hypothetical protein